MTGWVITKSYSKLQFLGDEIVSTIVKEVGMTFNAKALEHILTIPTNGFDIYIKQKMIKVYEDQEEGYLTTKFSHGRKNREKRYTKEK